MVLDEKELYRPVSEYFIKQGYFVVSGCEKPGIEGTAEFGLSIEDEVQCPDIIAAKWEDVRLLDTIAIECKRVSESRNDKVSSQSRSVGAGLWQAVNYQVAFDEVFIATEDRGQLGSKRSVLNALGIGHIVVNLSSKKTIIQIPADVRCRDRFNEGVRSSQVTPRLALFLAFTDVLGKPVRYGETFEGGGYIAKDMGSDVQLNGWIDERYTCFGINMEHIAGFRIILARLDWSEFETYLKKLGRYMLVLTKDPVPGRRGAKDVVIVGPTPCSKVDVSQLRKKIEKVVYDKSRPHRWRPHLSIFVPLWDNRKPLSKPRYLEKIQSEKKQLTELLELLTSY